MKKLFASASYSFNNFYDNLNTQGQIVFSLIMALILILCVILFLVYIFDAIKNKTEVLRIRKQQLKLVTKNQKENIKKTPLNIEQKNQVLKSNNVVKKEEIEEKEETKIEDIASAISDALKEEQPISMTNFEEDQEKTAIISIDELIEKAKELELVDDEENTGVNYLEKYNLEPAEVNEVVSNTMKIDKNKEIKTFKVSQVISPIYGVKKDAINDKEA